MPPGKYDELQFFDDIRIRHVEVVLEEGERDQSAKLEGGERGL